MQLLYFGQKYYADDLPNVLQYEINIIRDNMYQYVEIKTSGVGSTIGDWNIINGVPVTDANAIKNTCGDFQTTGGPVVGGSYVFRSDLTGNNWEFIRNYSIAK